MRKLLFLLSTAALLATGCRASVNANLNANAKTGQSEEFDEPLSSEKGEAEADIGSGEQALLGARHDLTLAPAKKNANCRCLAVVAGGAGDPAFQWQGGAPRIDAASQLVVALSSEGLDCQAAPADSLGASYWGYRLSGDDVVIIVENARFGRPVTQGAIIPRPLGNGRVYVKPASKDVPFGAPLSPSDKLCAVSAPPPTKSAPAGNMDQDTGGL